MKRYAIKDLSNNRYFTESFIMSSWLPQIEDAKLYFDKETALEKTKVLWTDTLNPRLKIVAVELKEVEDDKTR